MLAGVEHARLVSFVTRIVGSQDAEDVVQDAYLKALLAADSFRGDSKASSWVFRIAQRCAFDHLRLRRRRPQHYGAEVCTELMPDASTRHAVDPIDLERALAALPERFLIVVDAYAAFGSYSDAANALGMRVSAFKSRLHRARLLLRRWDI